MTCANSEEYCNTGGDRTFSKAVKKTSMSLRSSQSNKAFTCDQTNGSSSKISNSRKQKKVSHTNMSTKNKSSLPALALQIPSELNHEPCPSISPGAVSPVLGLSVIKERQFVPFTSSTPDAVFTNSSSPKCNKSDLVLNVLDRLCSPISSKCKPIFQLKNQNKNHGDDKKSSKRLFNNSFEDSLPVTKRKKTSDADTTSHESFNHFKILDVSDNTLNDVCEAADNIIEDIKLQETCLKKETLNAIPKSCINNVDNSLQTERNEFSSNVKIHKLHEKDRSASSINRAKIYTCECVDTSRKNEITLNDLFLNIRDLEEANKFASTNLKYCKQSENNDFNKEIKNKHLCALNEMALSVKSETPLANDSVIISDTQCCQILEAAEMVTNLEDTFMYSSNKNIEEVPEQVVNHVENIIIGNNDMNEGVDSNTTVFSCCSPDVSNVKSCFRKEENVCTDQSLIIIPPDSKKKCLFNDESLSLERNLLKALDTVIESNDEINSEIKNGENSKDNLHEAKVLVCDDKPGCGNAKSFFTANGKYVGVTKESLQKAKLLFEEDFQSNEMEISKDDFYNGCSTNIFSDIQCGKKENSSEENSKINVQDQFLITNNRKGFQTANGKFLTVSSKSLHRVKQLFSDIDSNEKDNDFEGGNGYQIKFKGNAQSRSDICNKNTRQVKVSREKSMEYNYDAANNVHGFITSSKTNVAISNESLEKNSYYHPNMIDCNGSITTNGKVLNLTNEFFLKDKLIQKGETDFNGCEQRAKHNTQSQDITQMNIEAQQIEDICRMYDHFDNAGNNISGFKSASGKNVEISEENLESAKHMLYEDKPNSPTIKGFLTAGGKHVEVSNASLMKAKQLFADESTFEDLRNHDSIEPSIKNVGHSTSMEDKKGIENGNPQLQKNFGFKTAGGKPVNVCNKSLLKAKELLCEIFTNDDDDDDINNFYQGNKLKTESFTQGSTKIYNESQQIACRENYLLGSLKNSNEEYKTDMCNIIEIPSDHLEKENNVSTDNKHDLPNVKGFYAANGKKVTGSNDSLMKAKELFIKDSHNENRKINDLEVSSENHLCGVTFKNTDEDIIKGNQPIQIKIGFETASGKFVNVSNKSLIKAKQLLNEICLNEVDDLNSCDKENKATTQCFTQDNSQTNIQAQQIEGICKKYDDFEVVANNGSTTASGGNMEHSEKHFENAKPSLSEDKHDVPIIKGFLTAGGKHVKVSNASLMKAKQLFADECNAGDQIIYDSKESSENKFGLNILKNNNEEVGNDIPQINKNIGFETASGKFVNICDKSLHKAKQLFNKVNDENHFDPGNNNNKFKSPSSTLQSSLMNNEAHQINDVHTDFDTVNNAQGFKTASGKNVIVKKECLEKAKLLFKDDDQSILDIEDVLTYQVEDVKIKSHMIVDQLTDKESNRDNKLLVQGGLGFETASGKSVKVSNESLLKAKQLFNEAYRNENNSSNSDHSNDQNEVHQGNHYVEDSHESSKKYSSGLIDSPVKDRSSFDNHYCPTKISMEGFQTASGKHVNVSKDNLEKARELFEEGDSARLKNIRIEDGNNLSTFAKSIHQSKQLFKPESDFNNFALSPQNSFQTCILNQSKQNIGSDMILKGKPKAFVTASGKFVNVSTESLIKAKQIFNEMTHGLDNPNIIPNSDNRNEQYRKTLEDDEIVTSKHRNNVVDNSTDVLNVPGKEHILLNDDYSSGSLQIHGFQTANGKNVAVSNDHLEKAKALLSDADSDIYDVKIGNITFVEDNKMCVSPEIRVNNINNCNELSRENIERLVTTIKNESAVSYTKHKQIKRSNSKFEKPLLSCDFNRKISKISNDSLLKARQLLCHVNAPSLNKSNSHCDVSGKTGTKYLQNLSLPNKLLFKKGMLHDPRKSNSYVISDDDLSLLNESITNIDNENSQQPLSVDKVVCKENDSHSFLSHSVVSEISESLAAIIADDESNPPFLLEPCVSSPSTIFDRNINLPALNCYENVINVVDKQQLSPILHNSKSLHHYNKNPASSVVRNLSTNIDTPPSKGKSFNPPYITSTPNDFTRILKTKRSNEYLNVNTPPLKRRKISQDHKDHLEIDLNIQKLRKKHAEEQEKEIKFKIKKKKSIKPCKGSYLLKKQLGPSKKLQFLSDCKSLQKHSFEQLINLEIKPSVIFISAPNAADFKFIARDYYSEETSSNNIEGIPVGDGAALILDSEGKAGVEEVSRAFLSSPAVDPALISLEWVKNHYRWLVLKFASMERTFPDLLANRYLTPNHLLLQLKYRYDREIDRCQRSALRKVLEKDEHASKPMILFVSDILQESEEMKALELSDGWYSVRTTIDHEMQALIRKKRVEIGTKLLITGAEIINNDDGCHPLEVPADVRLKVCTNCVRRVRWHARLGFYHGRLPVSRITDVLSRGGAVQAVSAVVARSYPVLFMEKCQEGRKVIRGERAEQIAADKYQVRRQQSAEVIMSQLQRNLEKSKTTIKRPVTENAIKQARDTKELFSLLEDMDDIGMFQDILNKDQLTQIMQLKQERASKVQQELQEKLTKQLNDKIGPRVVTRMLKVSLAEADETNDRSALLTVWGPSDDVMSLLVEGSHVILHNVTASGYSRFGDLQLTGGRQTRFELVKRSPAPREITSLSLLSNPDFRPQFNEIDIVGVVLDFKEENENSNKQLIYLADHDYNFVAISFWTDLKESGYSSIVAPGAVIAASNLHWRTNLVCWSLPSAFATEVSVFSRHPRQPHLQQAVTRLNTQLGARDMESYKNECVKKIKALIAQRNSGGVNAVLRAHEDDKSETKPALKLNGVVSPLASCSSSLPANSDTPTSRKIEWLERFGEPPPVSPLLTSTPLRVRKPFCPPTKRTK